ncbi:MAG: sarcosine oxidase subunit gamma family protein [Pseudomonadota bacterium]
MDKISLKTRFVLADTAVAGQFGQRGTASPGVIIQERRGLQIRHLACLAGGSENTLQKLSSLIGQTVGDGGGVSKGAGQLVVGAGPGQWFWLCGELQKAQHLAEILESDATLTDHTSAKVVLRVSGPNVRDALAKGCQVDLDPSAFRQGHATTTQIDQVVCQIWRADEAQSYDVMVARSLARSFWSWLAQSSSEFGYDVLPPVTITA